MRVGFGAMLQEEFCNGVTAPLRRVRQRGPAERVSSLDVRLGAVREEELQNGWVARADCTVQRCLEGGGGRDARVQAAG